MLKNKDGILKGAAYLGVATFVAKFLGALYRIPLTNLIGSYGLGLYQTVFPVYALLLDLSGAGAPSAISKVISSYKGKNKPEYAYNYFRTAITLFLTAGLTFSIVMLFFAKSFATLQGNPNAYLGYIFLSPAVILVCVISCYRGYFQGFLNMRPTAISQIIEQVVKLVLGLSFAYLAYPNIPLAVAGATFAITLSELVALIQLNFAFKKNKKLFNYNFVYNKTGYKRRCKTLIKFAMPIIAVALLIPLSHVIDSVIIVNLLKTYRSDATSLYGILSGAVHTVINLPVAICYGIATVAMPSVSSARNNTESDKRAQKTLLLTMLFAIPAVIACYSFAPLIINLLFRSFSQNEKAVAVNLLRLCSPTIILLSLVQTQNAILIGKNKLYAPAISLLLGIVLKTVVNIILLRKPSYNIYGGAIGSIACYFFTCLINLIMIIKLKVKNEGKTAYVRQLAN